MTNKKIIEYVASQASNIFPDDFHFLNIDNIFDSVISKTLFTLNKTKLFSDIKEIDVLNSLQYPIFLYNLSRMLFLSNDIHGAIKIFYLNKVLHSIDLYYEIELGKVFFLSHCVGSVFCKAIYGNYLLFFQGILIGKNGEHSPIIGNDLVMYTGSKLIGNCKVGNNVVISAGVTVIDYNIPDNVYVFDGKGRKPIFKDLKEIYTERYFIKDQINHAKN